MILKYISFVVIFNFVYSICPNGTLSYRWWCYKVVDKNATFKEAIIECHQYGGTLAQVESKEELDFLELNKSVQNGYWIGGMHLDSSYSWLASGAYNQTVMKAFLKRYLYEDPYQLWCLNLQYKCHFCGKEEIYNKKEIDESKGWYLYDSYCNETKPFICLVPQEKNFCPISWTYSNLTKKCYKFVPLIANRYQANEICDFESSELASIHSNEENIFIGKLLHNTQSAWIGLYVNETDSGKNESFLLWDDGSKVDFLPWTRYVGVREKRSNLESAKECFAIHKTRRNAIWYEEDCENTVQGVICMKNIIYSE